MNKSSIALVLIGLAFAFVSCGKPDPALLEGTWQAIRQESEMSSDTTESKANQTFTSEQAYQYTFHQGRMVMTSGGSNATFEASYKLDGHDLTLSGNDGRMYQYEINELDEKSLKLKAKSTELGKKSELTITFRRISQFNPYPTPSASPSAFPAP